MSIQRCIAACRRAHYRLWVPQIVPQSPAPKLERVEESAHADLLVFA